jgi:CheY-like chemotaxis protein
MALRQIDPGGLKPSRDGTSPRILYVEDEDLNWRITERQLRDGYTLTRARDAREAFCLLNREKFELILMDIQLSGSELDGIEIARLLKGNYRREPPDYAVPPPDGDKIPIVFVTAFGSRYSRNALLLVGGSDVIYKPVSFVAMTECLTRLTQRGARRPQKPPGNPG